MEKQEKKEEKSITFKISHFALIMSYPRDFAPWSFGSQSLFQNAAPTSQKSNLLEDQWQRLADD